MAAKDLITVARAKQSNRQITDGSFDTQLQTWVTACSDWVEKYCRRDFYARSYDELYSGNGDRRLMLRQYPVQAVKSVRYRPVTVLKVLNNDQAANQQARVTVTSSGLSLTRVASGTSTTDTSVTFAGNPTLTSVAAAVNALGNGWSAQVVGDGTDYGKWPSADLYVPPSYGDGTSSQGGLTARGTNAELKLHTYELSGYQWDARGWLLRAIPYTDPELLHPEDLVWPVGVNNFRVQYTAGYTTIPEAVQEACAQLVSLLWSLSNRDPLLLNQITNSSGGGFAPLDIPLEVKALLAPYRRYTVATNQG